jgi:phosphinothricin acetyltransferase
MPPRIRLATEADADQVLAIYGPFCYTPVSFEVEAPSLEEMRRRLAAVAERFPWLVCVEDGRVLGYAYASSHRARTAYQWSVEVSAYVADGMRGRGIGKELYTRLFQILVLQGFVNAYAGITLPNPASVRLHESVGFSALGVYHGIGFKYGTWHDVGWWEKTLCARPANPNPPAALSDALAKLPAVRSLIETER